MNMNTSPEGNAETLPPSLGYGATRKAEKLKRRRRPLSGKQLHRLSWTLLKLRNKIEEAARVDSDLLQTFKPLDEAWIKTYKLAEQRELVSQVEDLERYFGFSAEPTPQEGARVPSTPEAGALRIDGAPAVFPQASAEILKS
jgi:hypothetical protein